MKNLKLLVLLGVAFFVFGAVDCQPERDLSVAPSELTFESSDTGEKQLAITTDAKKWDYQVVGTADWVVTRKVDNVLYVSVKEYKNTSEDRTAIINITADKAPAVPCMIKQNRQNTHTVSQSTLTFEANETAEKTVAVTSNAPSWEPSTTASWITLTKNGSNVNVKVSNYTSTSEDRTGVVTIKGGSADDVTFSVTQRRRNTLSVSPSSITFNYGETSAKSFTITTNASKFEVSAVSWLSYNSSGNSLSVAPTSQNTSTSDRTATITFTAGSANAVTTTVIQKPNTLDVTPGSLSFSSSSGSKTFSISSGSSWSVTKSASWITSVSPTSGSNNGTVTVTVSANTSTSARTGTVTVTGSGKTVTVTVTQDGATPQQQSPQVRFRKSAYDADFTQLAIHSTSQYRLAYYNFGASTGISPYYTIDAGVHHPTVYSLVDNQWYTLPIFNGDSNTYTFRNNNRYTWEYFGVIQGYYVFGVTEEGTFNLPDEGMVAPLERPEKIQIKIKKEDMILLK